MTRYGMMINLNRCVGCDGCTLACKQENATPAGVWWASVLKYEMGKHPNAIRAYQPMLCMHCENAPCVSVCPTGASYKRADGIVAIDYDKCIGCKYCIQACPYGARHYIDKVRGYFPDRGLTPFEQLGYQKHQAGVVEKCTFCLQRIDPAMKSGSTPGADRAATPACVITCIGYARVFGDLDDPNSDISKQIIQKHARPLKPELGTEPSVYYVSLPEER